MGDYTTPYEREILTHYFVSQEPFRNEGALAVSLVSKFVDMGLLKRLYFQNEYGAKIAGNSEALRVYMAALAAVPLPVQRWVVPDPTEGG